MNIEVSRQADKTRELRSTSPEFVPSFFGVTGVCGGATLLLLFTLFTLIPTTPGEAGTIVSIIAGASTPYTGVQLWQ